MSGSRYAIALGISMLGGFAQAQTAEQAQQWLRQGQSAQALQAYTQLTQSSPRDPDLWLGKGLAHARQAQWPEATQSLETAASLAPGYADVWSALADVYRWNDRPAAAADAYARLASLRPQDPQPQYLRAKTLLASGDLEGARLAAGRARTLGASDADMAALDEQLKPAKVAPEPLGNSPASGGHNWSVSAGESRTVAAAGDAREQSVALRRYTDLGSIAVERLQLQRFGMQDVAYAVDAYPRLWNGAYANVRVQSASAHQLYPRNAWRAELYQNVGSGWELAASHDELGFDSHVRIEGVSVGRYWGNFFARWRRQSVRTDVSSGQGDRLFVRYYYEGDADHYLEANASRGRSADFSTAVIQPSRSDSRGLVLYHFVTRDWGFKLSWSQAKDSSISGATERNAGLGLMYRW